MACSFKKILIAAIMISYTASAASPPPHQQNYSWQSDLKNSGQMMLEGSYLQFTGQQFWIQTTIFAPLLAYFFHEDKRLSHNIRHKKRANIYDTVEVLAIASTFPLVPLISYVTGRKQKNHKLVQFSLEYLASMYLPLLESGVLSYLPVHDRPSMENLNMWETDFRGGSSFPSGHVIPLAALAFKSWEFYGPKWGVPIALLTLISSYERVLTGKHYPSDVVGGIFLAGLATYGVSLSAKRLFPSVNNSSHQGSSTPQLSFTISPYLKKPALYLNYKY